MLTTPDIAQARYERARAAANDDRLRLISATVTINLGGDIYTFPAIGTSVDSISASAEELAGDDPFGYSVMVHQ